MKWITLNSLNYTFLPEMSRYKEPECRNNISDFDFIGSRRGINDERPTNQKSVNHVDSLRRMCSEQFQYTRP